VTVRSRGTTLIELMVVMAVWSTIMVAVLGFYIYGTKVNRKNDEMSEQIRTMQLVADKLNSYLRNSCVTRVDRYPAKVVFDRVEEGQESMPGVLLPNLRPSSEYLRFGPNPKYKALDSDPRLCVHNALFYGTAGREEIVVQLPPGLVFEFVPVPAGLIFVQMNDREKVRTMLLEIPANSPDAALLKRWKPVNHYLYYPTLVLKG
jgi:type II secretory pathway pseudopilin PulG